MDPIRFSIVTVTRNAAAQISRCLESVAVQTYPGVEHLVIDGVSNDGTQAIVRAQSPRAVLVSEPDAGIYDAMNKGLARASGDYILFLGADDQLLDSRVLADAAELLENGGRPDLAYGALQVQGVDGASTTFRPPPPEGALDLMICGCLPHQATFAHRRLFARIGGFDTRYRVQADYDWFLRALGCEGASISRLDRVIAVFAMGGASSRLEEGQAETFAIQNAFPIYRQPEWMEKRVEAFQRATLSYRLQLQALEGGRARGPVERMVRRALAGLRR